MRGSSTRAAVALTLAIALACLAAASRAVAQPAPDPGLAVARLQREGYIARFTWSGESTTHGELRYRSPTEYSALIEYQDGGAVEYILLDPWLYSRVRRAESAAWGVWQRREWHPDAPVPGLEQYHPRLPLELLRRIEQPRDLGLGGPFGRLTYGIEGTVQYLVAIYASYEDQPPTLLRQTAEVPWPLTAWLDPDDGMLVQLQLTIPSGVERPLSVVTFTIDPITPELPAPDAEEAESSLMVRPAPDEPARDLPLTTSGDDRTIRSRPFRSTSGSFIVRLEPAPSGIQYQLWRIKRGRQLLATFGTAIGDGDAITLPFDLAPGEYVVEAQLPVSQPWTVSVQEAPPGASLPLAGGIHYAERHESGDQ